MTGLRQLIREIHRRSLWQVLGIYLVGSWLVLQAVDPLAGALNLPRLGSALRLPPADHRFSDRARHRVYPKGVRVRRR